MGDLAGRAAVGHGGGAWRRRRYGMAPSQPPPCGRSGWASELAGGAGRHPAAGSHRRASALRAALTLKRPSGHSRVRKERRGKSL
ncbi:hypothetical protein R1flu_006591 [Riccia fluitans]|uniref:Uncharacterized protein n=1 Tax=Riccia fluitans TaxID=41844 RepID=A0ABD1YZH0_9MARC